MVSDGFLNGDPGLGKAGEVNAQYKRHHGRSFSQKCGISLNCLGNINARQVDSELG
jgi:hypothetical protein